MTPISPVLHTNEDPVAVETLRALQRLRERAWATASGLVCGVLLSVATLVLVLRGGEHVGPHLGLLAVFLPGYAVSYAGAAVGFVYAFMLGAVFGWLAGRVYNVFARTP